MFRFVILVCGIAMMAETIQGAAVPVELEEAGKAAHEVCVKESGVSEELITKAANNDLMDDDKLKCYLKCIFDQFGLIEKGDINWDMMLAIVPDSIKEEGTRTVQTCRAKISGTDLCQKAWDVQKCFLVEAPETYFVI